MRWSIGVVSGLILLAGCHKDIQNTEAVKQGILNHLAKRPDLVSMDVSVSSVSFRKDEADATVYFQAKGGAPGTGMAMNYILERRGNQWVVKGRGSSPGMEHGSNPHGGATPGTAPSPMPGTAPNPTPALPPGHPPIKP